MHFSDGIFGVLLILINDKGKALRTAGQPNLHQRSKLLETQLQVFPRTFHTQIGNVQSVSLQTKMIFILLHIIKQIPASIVQM